MNANLKDQGALLFFCFTSFKHFVPKISAARASAEWIDHRPALVTLAGCKSDEEADRRVIYLLRSMLVLEPVEGTSFVTFCQVVETIISS